MFQRYGFNQDGTPLVSNPPPQSEGEEEEAHVWNEHCLADFQERMVAEGQRFNQRTERMRQEYERHQEAAKRPSQRSKPIAAFPSVEEEHDLVARLTATDKKDRETHRQKMIEKYIVSRETVTSPKLSSEELNDLVLALFKGTARERVTSPS